MWCCANNAGTFYASRWLEDDEAWPHSVWPELLCCVVLAFPVLAKYAFAPLLVVYMATAYGLFQRIRLAYRIFRVQDRKSRITRGITHAASRFLVVDGIRAARLDEFRDGFSATMYREGRDAMWLRERVREATARAIERIAAGETSLIWTPECAKNFYTSGILLRAAMLLSGALVLAAGASAATAAIMLAVAYRLCPLLSAPLLVLTQRMFTVSAEFESARVRDITCHHEQDDRLRMTVMLDIVPR